MKSVVKYFFNGLLFTVPVAATIYFLVVVFEKIDGLLGLNIPGVGFLVTLAIITLIGFLSSNILTKGLVGLVDTIFTKVPLVKLIYGSLKDLIGAFVGEKKSFNKPVAVALTQEGGALALGFITEEDLTRFGLVDHVAVYFPQSYNFAGNLLIFPKDRVQLLQTESSELMTFIVSGGVSGK